MDGDGIRRLVEALADRGSPTLVGIGGFGCSGKSTLARELHGAQVVSTDAFWDGSGFALDRLEHEVIRPLAAGEVARFEAWDWASASSRGVVTVAPEGIVVIEGVCALHRSFRDAYALRVWLEVDRETRLSRAIARDGEAARAVWLERWMPREQRYFDEDQPEACADAVLDGEGRVLRLGPVASA